MLLHHPYLTSPQIASWFCQFWWCMCSNLWPRMIWCKLTLRLSSITYMVIPCYSILSRAAQKKPDCHFIWPGPFSNQVNWQMAAAPKHIILWAQKSFTRQKLYDISANNFKSGRPMFGLCASLSLHSPRLPPLPRCYLEYSLAKMPRADQQKHCVKWK